MPRNTPALYYPRDIKLSSDQILDELYVRKHHNVYEPKLADDAPLDWLRGKINFSYGYLKSHPDCGYYDQAKLTIFNSNPDQFDDWYLVLGLDWFHIAKASTQRYDVGEYRDYIFTSPVDVSPEFLDKVEKSQDFLDYYCNIDEKELLSIMMDDPSYKGVLIIEPCDFVKYFRVNSKIV